jgi:hypothetical protein
LVREACAAGARLEAACAVLGYDNDSFIFGPQGRDPAPYVAWKSCRNANLGYSGLPSLSVIPMMERGEACATKLNSRCQLGILIS